MHTIVGKQLEPPLTDDRLLLDTWLAHCHFPLLIAADELGVFPLLDRAPATILEIAASLALSARSAAALVGPLAALGYLQQHQGRFALTDSARTYLLPTSPYYYGGLLHPYRDLAITGAVVRDALKQDHAYTESQHGDIAARWATGELGAEQAAGIQVG